MIVKDESHVLAELVESVSRCIDYWVIVDTGSSDGTQRLVTELFAAKGIAGELHERPWRDFGHNRSEALALSEDRGDYIWVIDADDRILGELDFSALSHDAYDLRYGDDFVYWRRQILRNGLGWQYRGVLHEYAFSERATNFARLEGEYHIDSGRRGSRSLAADKYGRDAQVLEQALRDEPENERYWFYLGQSYFDAGDYAESKRAYTRRAGLGGWNEEVAYALVRVAQCKQALDEPHEEIVAAFLAAYEARPLRAEPLHHLAVYLRARQEFALAYLFARKAASIPYPEADQLFINAQVYRFRARDELALAAHYSGRPREARELWRELLESELPAADRERIERNLDLCLSDAGRIPTAAPLDAGLTPPGFCQNTGMWKEGDPVLAEVVRDLEVVSANPRDWMALHRAGESCRRADRHELAVLLLEACLHEAAHRPPSTLDEEMVRDFSCPDNLAVSIFYCGTESREAGFRALRDLFTTCLQSPLGRDALRTHGARLRANTRFYGDNPLASDYGRWLEPGGCGRSRVAIICDHGIAGEEWDPDTVRRRGSGGSEEAAVYAAEALARRACRVTVYGNPPSDTLHGFPNCNPRYVERAHFSDHVSANAFDDDRFDAMVVWRHPQAVGDLKRFAHETLLWLHDAHPATAFESVPWDDLEAVMWLSRFQYEAAGGEATVPLERCLFTSNGIVPEQFIRHDGVRRDPYRCIYASNYMRGLEVVLRAWPRVKNAFPAATLDIYYGWQTWLEMPPGWKPMMKALLAEVAPLGVRELGRVGHETLARELSAAGFWTYPCTYPETFCTTGMKAQMAGCVPVCIDSGALRETVPLGFHCDSAEQYPDLLIEALSQAGDEEHLSAMRQRMRRWGLDHSWDRIADDWLARLGLPAVDQILPTRERIVSSPTVPEIAVINLDRRPDRLRRFQEHAARRGLNEFRRIAAIDGSTLQMTEEIRHLFRGNDHGYRRGVVGCALSHLHAWREVQGPTLIFEDDVELADSFLSAVQSLLERTACIDPQWDLVLLGFTPWTPNAPTCEPRAPVRLVRMDWSKYMGGSFAYLLSPTGARRLLEAAAERGVPHAIDRFLMRQGAWLRAYAAAPAIASSPCACVGGRVDTDIQEDHSRV